jgi:hypothetical protein
MSGQTSIRIDRLVLPASQSGHAASIGPALERSVAAHVEGKPAQSSDALAERVAQAVAARIKGHGG